ncbi:Protein MAINTENANCE OF MERISTEMS [Linum perenne]
MFHLYHGESTITLEDVHFLTGLSVDGELVESQRRLPTDAISTPLGETPTRRLSSSTIEQHCRAYILDFFGSCIFADRSGAYVHLFFLPLLEDMSRIGKYAWGGAALSWLYRELGHSPSRDHICDSGG